MRNGKGWKSEFALQQLAQQVQLHESQNRHQKRQHHRQAIEVAGGRAHQRECHQYRSNNGCNYHTGAIRLIHLRTGSDDIEYRESIYVGYRYYDSFGIPVRFPFGRVIR